MRPLVWLICGLSLCGCGGEAENDPPTDGGTTPAGAPDDAPAPAGDTTDDADEAPVSNDAEPPFERPAPTPISYPGVTIEVVQPGSGDPLREGTWIRFHVVGRMPDGTVIDDSRSPGRSPYERFYPSAMMDGWAAGLVGIRVGERRRVEVPAAFAAGLRQPVPEGESATFEFECLEIAAPGEVNFPSGLTVETRIDGAGPAADFGSFVTVQLVAIVVDDEGEEYIGFDTRRPGGKTIQTGIPSAPGILVSRRAEPRLPNLSAALHGIRAGELRLVTLPSKHAFGGRPDRGLGVKGPETIMYEIECVEVMDGRVELDNGLIVEDLVVGTGRAAEIGLFARLRWTAMNAAGEVIGGGEDSEPTVTMLPDIRPPAVRGWNHGVPGMRVGGTRRLILPPALAFGPDPAPESGVEPGELVTYEITLLGVGRSPDTARTSP